MIPKSLIIVGMILGATLGTYIPSLWGVGAFSFTSIFTSLVGGAAGIWIAYRIGKQW